MANLGSEMMRLYKAIETHADERAQESRQRALSLIEELLSCLKKESQKEEVKILKEIIEDSAASVQQYRIKKKDLELYFIPFALRIV
jgi:stress response protein YsnF